MKKKKLRIKKTRFGELAREHLDHICLFESDPMLIWNLLTVNKHIYGVVTSPLFEGSRYCVFPIGLNDISSTEFEDDKDDELLIFSNKTEDIRPMEKSKRFGMSASNAISRLDMWDGVGVMGMLMTRTRRNPGFKTGSMKGLFHRLIKGGFLGGKKEKKNQKPMHYVRNIQVVERGLYFNDDDMKEVLERFPRAIGLMMGRMPHITDKLFVENIWEKRIISTLDIFGCERLTEELFFHPTMTDNLIHLEVSDLLEKLEKKNKTLKFKKLKKLFVKCSFGDFGCWGRPIIDPKSFPNLIKCDSLEEIVFIHPNILDRPRDTEPFFLEGFKRLKSLKIVIKRESSWKDCYISHLTNLETLDAPSCVGNEVFAGLKNLKRLKLNGSVHSKFTNEIFKNLNSLKELDLTCFHGVHLFTYDQEKKKFADEDIQLINRLKVLWMCCKHENYKSIILKGEEITCKCADYLKNTSQNLESNSAANPQKYVHFYCKNCTNCQKCGNVDQICQKIGLSVCDSCNRMTCCKSNCENCGMSFCGCTRVRCEFGFCDGDSCEFEALCSNCVNEMIHCENKEPSCEGGNMCLNCSSMCMNCKMILCEQYCIDVYDKKSETYESIPPEKRVCKSCLKVSNLGD